MSAKAVAIDTMATKRAGRSWRGLAAVMTTLIVGFLGNLYLLWPWMSSWGATPEERQKGLPGDDLVPVANLQTTKGITIRAPAANIYPWLLQLGVDRGGMYSYDWLENLFGLRVRTLDRIVPEFQNVAVGDFWRFTPRDYLLNPGPGLYVRDLQPDRAVLLCFGLENKPEEACVDTWQFVLEPQNDGNTRLLLRSRMAIEPQWAIKATYFVQFIMERKMLLEIRRLSERFANGVALMDK